MSSRGGRVAGYDLIRGLAIALVLLRHAWPNTFGGAGVAGVVLFFGLSGYLITGLLLNDLSRGGRVRYGRFYLHRALRLFPPLLLLVLGFLAVTLTLDPLDDRERIGRSILVALTYTSDIGGFDHGSTAFGHLWTLAIEEQFYLVWPLVLAMAIRTRLTPLVVAASGIALYAWCAVTVASSEQIEGVYTWPQSWAVVMVIGAAARIWQEPLAATVFGSPRRRRLLGIVALVVLARIALLGQIKGEASTYLVLAPVIGLCAVVLVFWMGQWRELPTPALRPLLALGTVSYACYLWNYAFQRWLSPDGVAPFVTALLIMACTVAAATVSWYLVERPAASLRRRLDRSAPPPSTCPRPGTPSRDVRASRRIVSR